MGAASPAWGPRRPHGGRVARMGAASPAWGPRRPRSWGPGQAGGGPGRVVGLLLRRVQAPASALYQSHCILACPVAMQCCKFLLPLAPAAPSPITRHRHEHPRSPAAGPLALAWAASDGPARRPAAPGATAHARRPRAGGAAGCACACAGAARRARAVLRRPAARVWHWRRPRRRRPRPPRLPDPQRPARLGHRACLARRRRRRRRPPGAARARWRRGPGARGPRATAGAAGAGAAGEARAGGGLGRGR
jgi:hypothetical protein